MPTAARDDFSGLLPSIIGHVLLLGALGMRLISLPAPQIPQVPLAIEATVIDAGALRRRAEAEEMRAQAERRRAEELERQRQAVAAEKRREQKAEQARMEAQRVAEAERRAEEARIAEQKRREEAERRRREAEQRRLEAERQAQFRRELEAEEQRLAAITSGKQAQYLALIRNRVGRNWVRPASAKAGVECVVHVTQIPGGEVVNVRVGRCNGDAGVVRSIIAAVRKASPLPPPTDPTLFDRNLRFTFKPEE